MYDHCEAEGILYAFGFGTNLALKQRFPELEREDNSRFPATISDRRDYQVSHVFEDYQAKSWPRGYRSATLPVWNVAVRRSVFQRQLQFQSA